MKKTMATAAAVLALCSAPAQAACWTPREVAAAQVRDLDTMLMVSALRCRFESAALLTEYNELVGKHRAGLGEALGVLKAHYVAAAGPKAGLDALDHYVTRVANRYGAGADGLSCASLEGIAQAALAEEPTLDALVALAERADVQPVLDEERCPVIVAIAR